MAKVSYSQYSMWSSCPQQFKLNYIDKLGTVTTNINLLFGTSLHEVIQHFLSVMYGVSKKQALQIDLEVLLRERMVENFKKEQEKMNGVLPCTRDELEEFYSDGLQIVRYFKSKLDKLYSKSGVELVGIEVVLNSKVKDGVNFIGFIDVVLRDKSADEIIIIDLKTSTNGWSKYQKNDKVKTSQMLLYKKFYSELFNTSIDKIKVEYHILKRKLQEDTEYPIPRISKFIPPNGKPSVNNAWNGFMEFVNSVYDDTGNIRDTTFEPNKGKQCDWCEFKNRELCSAWK